MMRARRRADPDGEPAFGRMPRSGRRGGRQGDTGNRQGSCPSERRFENECRIGAGQQHLDVLGLEREIQEWTTTAASK